MLPAIYAAAIADANDKCDACNHGFHGLSCERSVMGRACPCGGPWLGVEGAWLPRKDDERSPA